MKKQKTTTFQEALTQGLVKENDYFLVRYLDGRGKLFRLVETENGYVMWGPPTDEKVLFKGKEGYESLFSLADTQVKKEYSLPEVFEEIHACGLPQREYYEVHSLQKMGKILKAARIMYEHLDDAQMVYILASRCVWCNGINSYFSVFVVNNGSVHNYWLCDLDGNTDSPSLAVRPEAVPNPKMKLIVEGRDGSRKKPWICISSQEEMQEMNASMDTTGEAMASHSKEELMSLIQEGYEWLAKLEEYAKNLK